MLFRSRCSGSHSPRAPKENSAPTANGGQSTQRGMQVGPGRWGRGPGGRSQRPRLRACVGNVPRDAVSNSDAHGLRILVKDPSCGGTRGDRGQPQTCAAVPAQVGTPVSGGPRAQARLPTHPERPCRPRGQWDASPPRQGSPRPAPPIIRLMGTAAKMTAARACHSLTRCRKRAECSLHKN